MGNGSEELQAYVQQHFDQQRTLLNCKGQKKDHFGKGCRHMNNNQHVLSQQKWSNGHANMYVQCWMLWALYHHNSKCTHKDAILLSLDDPALTNHWARI